MTQNIDYLHHLLTEACQYPSGHLRRQQYLTQIIRSIGHSQALWQESSPNYGDALHQTWSYLSRHLCEVERGDHEALHSSNVMHWFNQYLKSQLQNHPTVNPRSEDSMQLDRPLEGTNKAHTSESVTVAAEISVILEETRKWAQTDPLGKLASIWIPDHADVTCQVLILRRLPIATSWEELSTELGISIATLSNFYQHKCIPQLRQFSQSRGWGSDFSRH